MKKQLLKHVKQIFVLVVAIILTVSVLPTDGFSMKVEAAEIVYSGTDGDLDWSIDSEGCLRITGSGDYETAEWKRYSGIKTAIVEVTDITSTANMFDDCWKMTSVDLSKMDTKNVTDMSEMFYCCESLTKIDASNLDTGNVVNMKNMFSGCEKLSDLDVSSFDTSNVTDMYGMFFLCYELTSLDLSSFNTKSVTDMAYMFGGCKSLEKLNVTSFNTSKVTRMFDMFAGCNSLTSLDVRNFDTTNVKDMTYMFNACSSLINLDLSNFNTTNVEMMEGMFNGCLKLESINLSNFNTKNVRTMKTMFLKCSKLVNLDLSNFDTNNVEYMNNMFADCSELRSLNVSSFNTQNVTSMYGIFQNCSKLTNLDLSGFDISHLDAIVLDDNMLEGCISLKKINTPINTDDEKVILPTDSNGLPWRDSYGNVYTKLPGNSTKSIVIARGQNTDWENEEESRENIENNSKPISGSINASPVKVSKITISGVSKNIAAGKKISLKATVSPINANNKKLIWSSSNKKVATVSQSGVVTIKKNAGGKSVTITAKAADGSGSKASWKIKVVKGVVKKVSVSGAKTVKAGKSLKLKAKVTATKGANKKLKWTSSNPKYAKVSASGKVTALKAGKGKKVKITAMATDGSNKKKTVTIKIK